MSQAERLVSQARLYGQSCFPGNQTVPGAPFADRPKSALWAGSDEPPWRRLRTGLLPASSRDAFSLSQHPAGLARPQPARTVARRIGPHACGTYPRGNAYPGAGGQLPSVPPPALDAPAQRHDRGLFALAARSAHGHRSAALHLAARLDGLGNPVSTGHRLRAGAGPLRAIARMTGLVEATAIVVRGTQIECLPFAPLSSGEQARARKPKSGAPGRNGPPDRRQTPTAGARRPAGFSKRAAAIWAGYTAGHADSPILGSGKTTPSHRRAPRRHRPTLGLV